MNKDRRREILNVVTLLDHLKSEIEGTELGSIMENVEQLRDEEQEYRDNMPDSIGEGAKGDFADVTIEQMQEAYDKLETLQGEFEDGINEAIQSLEEAAN